MATGGKFNFSEEYKIKSELTISTKLGLSDAPITYFRLGVGTDISKESYDSPVLYIGTDGSGRFHLNENDEVKMSGNDILYVAPKTLCGMSAGNEDGLAYIEILLEKEINMNSALKAGEVTKLKNLLDYEKGSITNLDLIGQDNLKFMIMAFDEGCYLSEHRAPGEAIVFALEGKGIINYEGTDYEVNEGDNFKFDKNALHSVKAVGRFKMALLLVK
jgi:hypothetical protein